MGKKRRKMDKFKQRCEECGKWTNEGCRYHGRILCRDCFIGGLDVIHVSAFRGSFGPWVES